MTYTCEAIDLIDTVIFIRSFQLWPPELKKEDTELEQCTCRIWWTADGLGRGCVCVTNRETTHRQIDIHGNIHSIRRDKRLSLTVTTVTVGISLRIAGLTI